jgi:hypothetical protein
MLIVDIPDCFPLLILFHRKLTLVVHQLSFFFILLFFHIFPFQHKRLLQRLSCSSSFFVIFPILTFQYIVSQMQGLGWEVELDSFVEPNTIVGQVPFSNIIATLDPAAPRRLVLACHYDSKASPAGFLGATDSAVPCAQMINLAHTMQMDLNDAKAAVSSKF